MKKKFCILFIISVLSVKSYAQSTLTVRSNTEGLHIGVSGNYAHWTSSYFSKLDEYEPMGLGGGVSLGYGINQHIEIIGSYNWHTFSFKETWDEYSLSSVGAAFRYNMGGTLQAIRPFVEVGYNYQNIFITPVDLDGQLVDLQLKGGQVGVGGGLNFFASPKFAINIKAGANLGKFSSFLLGSEGQLDKPDAKIFHFGLGLNYFLN
jgi:Outer membrane protein beta-barrel domain